MRVAQAYQPHYYRKNRANKRLVSEEFFCSVNTWPGSLPLSLQGAGRWETLGTRLNEWYNNGEFMSGNLLQSWYRGTQQFIMVDFCSEAFICLGNSYLLQKKILRWFPRNISCLEIFLKLPVIIYCYTLFQKNAIKKGHRALERSTIHSSYPIIACNIRFQIWVYLNSSCHVLW